MALTRSYLKGMGLDDDKVDAIIDQHSETVTALKADRDKHKNGFDKLAEVQKELDDLKAKGDDGWQAKYEKVNSDFEAYKTAQTAKETRTAKENAYKALLKEANISEKAYKLIINATDFDTIELDEAGSIKNVQAVAESIKSEYSDFVVSTAGTGAEVQTPPSNDGGITKEQFNSMSYNDRLKLYNEQPEVYRTLNLQEK